ncbi:MAG TPA: methyltransferase domain-containing protein [Candidatus Binataceae bacterium]|nr:methyltransferase domain-containing protein [Candidatus Binataceae bacterium]
MSNMDAHGQKSDQKRDWDAAAAGWQKWWPVFERAAQHVSDRLVELAGVKPGDRVLDIATGNGEPAVTAARRAGAAGRVLATDQSSGMLAIARERATALCVTNLQFQETDAESLAVSERDFDAVVCRWGLMFMPDLASALTGIRGRMKPGARFATSVWSTPDKVPMITVGADIVRKLANLPPPPPGALDPLRLADTAILKSALEATGFRNVTIERLQVVFEFASPDAFTQFRRDVSAPFRALLERQTAEMRERILAAVSDAARAFVGADGKLRTVNETILFAASN